MTPHSQFDSGSASKVYFTGDNGEYDVKGDESHQGVNPKIRGVLEIELLNKLPLEQKRKQLGYSFSGELKRLSENFENGTFSKLDDFLAKARLPSFRTATFTLLRSFVLMGYSPRR